MVRGFLGLVSLILFILIPVDGNTDSPDVAALSVMYNSLGSPSQLSGWKASGGDPCGGDWKGITCSGSSVTQIKLSGLGLSGSMGYQLSSLTSVTYFDLSKNKLKGDIPYQLPPNAVHIDLSGNSLTGGVPYSISQMSDLKYLDLGHNKITGQLSDMFGQLHKLAYMDLSFNTLSGNLPQSFASLSSLKELHLGNNHFSGSINVLAKLRLDSLTIANNKFSGSVPKSLRNIDELETTGNSWSGSGSENDHHGSKHSEFGQSGISGVTIAIIVMSVLLVLLVIILLVSRRKPSYESTHYLDEEKFSQRKFSPLVSHELSNDLPHGSHSDFKDFSYSSKAIPAPEMQSVESFSSINVKGLQSSPSMGLKPPPSIKSFNDTDFGSRINVKRSTSIRTVIYSLADLQSATGNFASGRLLGEGSVGRVYRAKYSDGKVQAVKKIDSSLLQSMQDEDITEMISKISKLHHTNITELIGYCSEQGHTLLVYEYFRNGSLHEFLHLNDDYGKPLTWNTRIRIALGTARAVEYLHEICSPSTVHKDIKSANILLDAELNPRLTDCGLGNFYQVSSKPISGPKVSGKRERTSQNLGVGYNAPECTKPSAYTLKSDVYSFGVVMLELLTGRMPYDSKKPRSEQSLVRWATPQLHDIDALAKMVDPALHGLYPPKSLSRFADVIALCVQSEPEFRPPMSEVVQALVRLVQRSSMAKRGDDSRLSNASSRKSDSSDVPDYY